MIRQTLKDQIMTDQTHLPRVERLKSEAQATRLEANELADTLNESTGVSWLWAFLFGPLYFAAHGFWSRALIIFVLNFFFIGFILAPFMAYPAWRERARKKAEQMITIDKMRGNS